MEDRLACVRKKFEDKWKSGHRPKIEKYLLMVPARERPLLLVILTNVDCLYRQKAGEPASPTEYVDKFPYDSVILREHLAGQDESDQLGAFTTEDFWKLQDQALPDPEIVAPADLTPYLVASHPKQLGRYVLIKSIGKGGFGEVFRARDPNLDRDVALKTMLPNRATGAKRDEKLLAEGKKVASLEHPGIVRVYDADFDQGWHFLVTELLTGGTLADCLRAERYDWTDAALLIAEIADALQHAHEKGIFHRDLKPQNILIDGQGKPRIADFGLAATEEDQLLEVAGALGTYPYMPPEIINGGGNIANERSDIYSLGCIFYQLLTDRMMYKASTPAQWRKCIAEKTPRSPRLIVKSIPPEVETICLKCLSKNPAERYAIAADLARELRSVVAVDAAARLAQQRKPKSRAGVIITTIAGSIAAVIGLGLWSANLFQTKTRENQTTREPREPTEGPLIVDPNKFPRGLGSVVFNEPMKHWEQLMTEIPNLLFWPEERRGSNILWDRESFELTVNSPNVALIELGQTDQPDFNFQVCIQQNGWHGGAGIFVGYQNAPEFGPGKMKCHGVVLERGGVNQPDALNIWVKRTVLSKPSEIHSQDRILLAGPYKLPRTDQVLVLEIRKHQIHGLSWGGVHKLILHEPGLPIRSKESFRGRFGIFVSTASAQFHKAFCRVLPPGA